VREDLAPSIGRNNGCAIGGLSRCQAPNLN
jgi:hypothetical protein